MISILLRPGVNQLSKADATDLVNSFETFDKNGDGFLQIDEFCTALGAVRAKETPIRASYMKPKQAAAAEAKAKAPEAK